MVLSEVVGVLLILLFLFYPLFMDEFALGFLAGVFKGRITGDFLTKRIVRERLTIFHIALFRFGGVLLNSLSFIAWYWIVSLVFRIQGKAFSMDLINDVIQKTIVVFDFGLLLAIMKTADGFLIVFLSIHYFLAIFVFFIALSRIMMNFINKLLKPIEKYY